MATASVLKGNVKIQFGHVKTHISRYLSILGQSALYHRHLHHDARLKHLLSFVPAIGICSTVFVTESLFRQLSYFFATSCGESIITSSINLLLLAAGRKSN